MELSLTDGAPDTIQGKADQLVSHITLAATEAIPKSKVHNFRKDHWYTNNDLRKSKRLANIALRKYWRNPTRNNKDDLKHSFQNFKDLTTQAK